MADDDDPPTSSMGQPDCSWMKNVSLVEDALTTNHQPTNQPFNQSSKAVNRINT
jgi:hypothetical protein